MHKVIRRLRGGLALLLACACFAPQYGAAKLPERIEALPDTCSFLSEPVAEEVLGPPVRAAGTNEHYPTFHSQCEYRGEGPGKRVLGFVFKFMVREMFDVEALSPEQLDFSVGFAVGGLQHAEKLQFPGKVTYVFHDRDLTVVFMISGIDGPLNGAGEASSFVTTFRLTDGKRTPEARRDILMKFPWQVLAGLNSKD